MLTPPMQDAGDHRQRDEDAVVQVLVGELAAAGLEADDLELVAAHAHRLADRVLAGEQAGGRVQAEQHHLAAEAHVGVGDPPPARDALVVDRRVGRGHADEPGVGPESPGRDDLALDVLMRRHQADHRELGDLGDVTRA